MYIYMYIFKSTHLQGSCSSYTYRMLLIMCCLRYLYIIYCSNLSGNFLDVCYYAQCSSFKYLCREASNFVLPKLLLINMPKNSAIICVLHPSAASCTLKASTLKFYYFNRYWNLVPLLYLEIAKLPYSLTLAAQWTSTWVTGTCDTTCRIPSFRLLRNMISYTYTHLRRCLLISLIFEVD